MSKEQQMSRREFMTAIVATAGLYGFGIYGLAKLRENEQGEVNALKMAADLLHESDLSKAQSLNFTMKIDGVESTYKDYNGSFSVRNGQMYYGMLRDDQENDSLSPDLSLGSDEMPIEGTNLLYNFKLVSQPSKRNFDALGNYDNWIEWVNILEPESGQGISFGWYPFFESANTDYISIDTEHGLDPVSGDPSKPFPLYIIARSNDATLNYKDPISYSVNVDKELIDRLTPVAKSWSNLISSDDRFWSRINPEDRGKSRPELIKEFVIENAKLIGEVFASR